MFIAFCLELRSQPHGFHTCHNQRPFHGTFAFGQGLKTPELNWNSMKPLRTPELGNMAQHFPRHAPRQATEQATEARHGLRHPGAHLATIVEKKINLNHIYYIYNYIIIYIHDIHSFQLIRLDRGMQSRILTPFLIKFVASSRSVPGAVWLCPQYAKAAQ